MGKKKANSNLGRALIKDRFGNSKGRNSKSDSLLHIADLNDGFDWGRLNLQSVTEESSFQEFLSTAQLAGTEFQAEKLNITFVNPKNVIGLLTDEERLKVEEVQSSNKQFLHIPRRPKWDVTTTAEQLQFREQEDFIEWRRKLAILQEEKNLIITPYEKNLEFWRQLWRVVERSDVVVQIVDARNPLLFRCEDLEHYVLEVNPNKLNLILVNKADFLTSEQREIWAHYFTKEGVRAAFFSALLAAEENKISDNDNDDEESNKVNARDELQEERDIAENLSGCSLSETEASKSRSAEHDNTTCSSTEKRLDNGNSASQNESRSLQNVESSPSASWNEREKHADNENNTSHSSTNDHFENSPKLLSRKELISLFRNIHTGSKILPGVTTVGLVGYPNVGKSSTINSLLMDKKVSVSATPGKTKHFQTWYFEEDILLCDCPGLVMPSFVFTKGEMVINGILPIDQLRDHVSPATLVANLIPRHVFEEKYGLLLPSPEEGEDPERPPTAEELLNAYGYNRGFMTQNGQPDNARSARYILKDFVNGKLLYCCAPPGVDQNTFHIFPKKVYTTRRNLPIQATKVLKPNKMTTAELDKTFFSSSVSSVHQKGVKVPGTGMSDSESVNKLCGSASSSQVSINTQHGSDPKPWKNHKDKRNKKEKLRRVYSYLDN